ncbi:MAG: hypothetical protein V1921_08570 [Candidatus Altiarchaeota archaeon]
MGGLKLFRRILLLPLRLIMLPLRLLFRLFRRGGRKLKRRL